MMRALYLTTLINLLFALPLSGQCKSSTGSLIINEIGHYDQNQYGQHAPQFIEFLVAGSSTTGSVDVSGTIIDDNNLMGQSRGGSPGHIVLGDCFAEVPLGALIVIYSEYAVPPHIDPHDDGLPNEKGVYQLSARNTCLRLQSKCPDTYRQNYSCGEPSNFEPEWRTLVLNSANDVLQVRNSDASLQHALVWYSGKRSTGIFAESNSPYAVRVGADKINARSVALHGGSPYNSKSYEVGKDFTPGSPNSNANAELINSYKPSGCSDAPITLGCSDLGDEYCYTWMPTDLVEPLPGSAARVYPRGNTLIRRYRLDNDGNILDLTVFNVLGSTPIVASINQQQLKETRCVTFADFRLTANVTSSGAYQYRWSTGSTSQSITVSGGNTYSVTITGSDGCSVVREHTPYGENGMVTAYNIIRSAPALCADNGVQLRVHKQVNSGEVSQGDASVGLSSPQYTWSNGATGATTQVYTPGEYRVTVTTDDGCQFVERVDVLPGAELTVNYDDHAPCSSKPGTATANLTGYSPSQLLFEWSDGHDGPTINLTRGGSYTVTVTTAGGCEYVSGFTLPSGLEVSGEGSSTRLSSDGTATLSARPINGQPPYGYSWSTGQSDNQVTVTQPGDYTVTVTDAAGCQVTYTYKILAHSGSACADFSVRLLYEEPSCTSGGLATINTVVGGGQIVAGYDWSDGTTGPTTTVSESNQSYTLNTTSTQGCSFTTSITTPDITTLAVTPPLDDAVCALIDEIDLLSLADNQAMFVGKDLPRSAIARAVRRPRSRIDLLISYENDQGRQVNHTVFFAAFRNVPDFTTWAAPLEGVAAGQVINVALSYTTNTDCPFICTDYRAFTVEGSTDVVEVVVEEEPAIVLADYNCGDDFVPTGQEDDQTPLTALYSGELFYTNGFPILVTEVNQNVNSSGKFQGRGVVPLPFNQRTLEVEFDVLLNQYSILVDGEVYGIRDQLTNYDFSLDTLLVGGPICQPRQDPPGGVDGQTDPNTGIDQWGFIDSTGLHSVTGQAYDEYGFLRDGTHVKTQGPYSEQGCSREETDRDGNFCQPVRYVDPAAQAFIDSIAAELDQQITDALTQLIADTLSALNQRRQVCTSLRGDMDGLINQLGFDRAYIVGDSNQYYDPGLSTRFAEKPTPYQTAGANRDPQVADLEAKHIDLFGCDVLEQVTTRHYDLLTTASAADLKATLLRELSYQSEATITGFQQAATFETWLRAVILANVFGTQNPGYSYQSGKSSGGQLINAYKTPPQAFTNLGTWAGPASASGFATKQEMVLYELNHQFNQGFREVQGIHRAHFLQRLTELRPETNSGSQGNLLPLEITKYIGGIAYTILLDEVRFSATLGPTLSAYLIIEDPESGQKIVFEAINTAFGVGGAETSRLALASTVALRLNNNAKLILHPQTTFVDWDCTGFAGVGVGGQLELCRDLITPLDDNTFEPLPDPERFAVDFNVYATEWLDAVISVDAGNFAITGHEGFTWTVDTVVVDLSDKVTPSFVPCAGYDSRNYHEAVGLTPNWKGLYLKELAVRLPDDFTQADTPLRVGVRNSLIDERGFSGRAFVENVPILSLDDGSGGGWPFSIDRFNVDVLHNQFAGGGFGGEVLLPVFPDDALTYSATLEADNRFAFAVNGLPELRMNMLLAEARLDSNTTFTLAYGPDGFEASANLYGGLRMNVPSTEVVIITLPELEFTNLQISNRAPHFVAGTWKIADASVNLDFGGFGLDISRIRPQTTAGGREFGIAFDAGITLVGELDLTATGGFAVLGELVGGDAGARQRWNYKRFDLTGIGIETTIKNSIHIDGRLNWFKDHNEYGTGFHGVLSARFDTGPLNFSADVAGQFGRHNGNRYFFIDAMAGLGSGIPVGALNIQGFGGGISYHMDNSFSTNGMDFVNGKESHTGAPIGSSFSGVQYHVDHSVGLGLKATVAMNMQTDALFNGWASLEFLFNNSDDGGGLREISLKGQGQFLDIPLPEMPDFVSDLPFGGGELPIDSKPAIAAPLSAWVDVKYNFNDKVLDGTLEAYLDLFGVIEGVGDNKRLVQAQLHISEEKWFFNMGTPRNPAGARMRLGSLLDVSSTAYFNMGTDIPDFPGLPANVRSLTGAVNINEPLRKSGGGMMFGANIYASAGIRTGLIDAEVNAEVGFDLMLRDYGDARCYGANRPIGVNGWYSSGQAWAYLNGSVKILGARIFEAGIAGVLQARLPNPTWVKASMTAYAKLLFIRKKISFSVELGDQCSFSNPDGSPVEEYDYIGYIAPAEKVPYVDVDVKPEVFFTYPVGETIALDEDEFELEVVSVELRSVVGGYTLAHETELTSGGSVLKVIPHNLLPAEDEISVTVVVRALRNGIEIDREEASSTFFTAKGYDRVPQSNIAYSYPVAGMYDFHPDESRDQQGYIQLASGQAELFEEYIDDTQSAMASDYVQSPLFQDGNFTPPPPPPLSDTRLNYLVLEREDGLKTHIPFEYDVIERRITYDLPSANLTAGAMYKLTLVKFDGLQVVKAISDPIYFRVSNFRKFRDKLNAINAVATQTRFESLIKPLGPDLRFGYRDLFGLNGNSPLVETRVEIPYTYLTQLNEVMYNRMPIYSTNPTCPVVDFDGHLAGATIEQAGQVSGAGLVHLIANSARFKGLPDSIAAGNQTISYDVARVASNHHVEINQIIRDCNAENVDGTSGQERHPNSEDHRQQILDQEITPLATLPRMPAGIYKLKVTYRLPDGRETTHGEIRYTKNN